MRVCNRASQDCRQRSGASGRGPCFTLCPWRLFCRRRRQNCRPAAGAMAGAVSEAEGMPMMRYSLSFEDYCHLKKTLAHGRRITFPRRPANGKIELQQELNVNEYAYFQRQLKRRRQLGEPCTM